MVCDLSTFKKQLSILISSNFELDYDNLFEVAGIQAEKQKQICLKSLCFLILFTSLEMTSG